MWILQRNADETPSVSLEGSKHHESCQIPEMIGNDGIEIIIKDDIHGFYLHGVAIAFEDIVDAFWRVVSPAVNLPLITGFIKTVGV